MDLPLQPPVLPMLAKLSRSIPEGDGWLFEPKWDGFRCIVFRDGDEIELASRNERPFTRYFPELLAPLLAAIPERSVVDGEIVARPVGSVLTLIRRDALRSSYLTDWATCQSVARAGYRYGWMLDVRAVHLGWDDYKLHRGHLASKLVHGAYREVNLIERAPTLSELAMAGPVLAQTRAIGVPDAAVLELTWGEPAVAASAPTAVGRKVAPASVVTMSAPV